ncbi:kinase-like domain-containing protein [Cercophora scortea]|uniref:Kinase-like domain-containing protein n=1 Tax=Cercophora scortea TaxID=314031 RepID=A0AAE0IXS0_9PEZI|nr:kinase-like domain-containing protein [Cercophora scortea]
MDATDSNHEQTLPAMDSWTISFPRRSYDEAASSKGPEPLRRWVGLIVQHSSCPSKWHVRVAYHGALQSSSSPTPTRRPNRRRDLEDLCMCIDFQKIQLLDDTVTELVLARHHDADAQKVNGLFELPTRSQPDADSEYAAIVGQLVCVRLQEDPQRIRYPLLDSNGTCNLNTPTVDLADIVVEHDFIVGVYKVHVVNDATTPYIYKVVDRPLYDPRDTEVLEQELRNLHLLGGTEGIVRLVAAVVSKNPYQTSTESNQENNNATKVLRGILLEYHPNGTLQEVLRPSESAHMDGRWRAWGLQIAKALARLHQNGITHMDLKPTNIVITADWNVVLIDISGIGGVTREWLSPEMLNDIKPLSRSMEARKCNDIWALGKMLSAMADVSHVGEESQLLRDIAQAALQIPCSQRISLGDIIAKLST